MSPALRQGAGKGTRMEDDLDHLFDQHGDFADQEEYEEYVEFAVPAWAQYQEAVQEGHIDFDESDESWVQEVDEGGAGTVDQENATDPQVWSDTPWWGNQVATPDLLHTVVGARSQMVITSDRVLLYPVMSSGVAPQVVDDVPFWTVPRSAITGARVDE